MSRIGSKPIKIPDKVKINIDKDIILIEGPKGKLSFKIPIRIATEIKDSMIIVTRTADAKQDRMFHGLTRALLNNMVKGVLEGFTKELEIIGVGYRSEVKGNVLVLHLGFTNPVNFPIPEGVEVKTSKPTKISISGIDKQIVGDVSARIRKILPPEPYKGKGIRYVGEYVRKKLGKAATK